MHNFVNQLIFNSEWIRNDLLAGLCLLPAVVLSVPRLPTGFGEGTAGTQRKEVREAGEMEGKERETDKVLYSTSTSFLPLPTLPWSGRGPRDAEFHNTM